MNRLKLTGRSILFYFSIATIALLVIACQKESIEMTEDKPTDDLPAPLSWLLPTVDGQTKRSDIFIYSEGIIGSTQAPGYRVSGRLWDEADDRPMIASSIIIGDLVIPITEGGTFHQSYGPFYNGDDWTLIQDYPGKEIMVRVEDDHGTLQEFSLEIVGPLWPKVVQNGEDPFRSGEIDANEDLTIEWPVPANADITLQNGKRFGAWVGSTITYQPGVSKRRTGLTNLPTESISKRKSTPFRMGKITFTKKELRELPDEGLVTILVGRIRVEVDSNGEPVRESFSSLAGGGTRVGTGGVDGSPFIGVRHSLR